MVSNVKLKTVFILFASAIIFCGCKKYKYPESTFKGDPTKPENCPFHGKITAYKVNGIDSLNLLDKYIDSVQNTSNHIHISACEFFKEMPHAGQLDVSYGWGVGDMAVIDYKFSKDCKQIKIDFGNGRHLIKKNLFIGADISWDIVRLSPDDNPFKLKTTLQNGNVYEIQIR